MPEITREHLYERALKYLTEMVAIPSPSGDEAPMSRYLGEKLTALGLEVEMEPVGTRFNVIARTKGTGEHADLMLVGHIDTIPVVNGWVTDPFLLTEAGDRLYGLGASDQKGGIAAQLAALEAMRDTGVLDKANILVAFTPDEEALSDGMLKFLERKPKVNFALVSEPHCKPAGIGWPGKALLKVTVHGKSAHGGRPHQGVNAIEEAAKFLVALGEVEPVDHHHLGKHPFVTLSMKGGYERYSLTVPDLCEISISKQLVPGESKDKVMEMVNKAIPAVKQGRVEVSFTRPYYPPAEMDPDHPQIRRLRAVYSKVAGEELQLGYGRGVCDADYLVADEAIPSICFGPSGGNTHQPNEFVWKHELALVAEVYYRMCIEG